MNKAAKHFEFCRYVIPPESKPWCRDEQWTSTYSEGNEVERY